MTEQVTGLPTLKIQLRQDQLARYGVSAGEVLDFVAAIGNVQVGEIRLGQVRFPLSVRLPDEYRTDPERVAGLLIPTSMGQRLPLSRLADLKIVEGTKSNSGWQRSSRRKPWREPTSCCNSRSILAMTSAVSSPVSKLHTIQLHSSVA